MRGYYWTDLSGEIQADFVELSTAVDQFDNTLVVRSSNPVHDARSEMRADNREAAARYADIRATQRRTWGDVIEGLIPQLVQNMEPRRCKRGHLVDGSNMMSSGDCRACHNERERKNKAKRREKAMDEREGVTHHFEILTKCPKLKCVAGKIGENNCSRCKGSGIREVDGYLTCNTDKDGQLREIFIRLGKTGAEEAIYEQWAIAASLALRGMHVEKFFRKFVGTRFEPSGATTNEKIPRCTSILDYISRWILLRFASDAHQKQETSSV